MRLRKQPANQSFLPPFPASRTTQEVGVQESVREGMDASDAVLKHIDLNSSTYGIEDAELGELAYNLTQPNLELASQQDPLHGELWRMAHRYKKISDDIREKALGLTLINGERYRFQLAAEAELKRRQNVGHIEMYPFLERIMFGSIEHDVRCAVPSGAVVKVDYWGCSPGEFYNKLLTDWIKKTYPKQAEEIGDNCYGSRYNYWVLWVRANVTFGFEPDAQIRGQYQSGRSFRFNPKELTPIS